MQCPGSFLFAFSLALAPGTNWTSWISFAASGILQATLLSMFLVFKYILPSVEEPEDEERLLPSDEITSDVGDRPERFDYESVEDLFPIEDTL